MKFLTVDIELSRVTVIVQKIAVNVVFLQMDAFSDEEVEWGPPTIQNLKGNSSTGIRNAGTLQQRHTTIGLVSFRNAAENPAPTEEYNSPEKHELIVQTKKESISPEVTIDLCSDTSSEFDSAAECDAYEDSCEHLINELKLNVKEEPTDSVVILSSDEDCHSSRSLDDPTSPSSSGYERFANNSLASPVSSTERPQESNGLQPPVQVPDLIVNPSYDSSDLFLEDAPKSSEESDEFNDTLEEINMVMKYGLQYTMSGDKRETEIPIEQPSPRQDIPSIRLESDFEFKIPSATPNPKKAKPALTCASPVMLYIKSKTACQKRSHTKASTPKSLFKMNTPESNRTPNGGRVIPVKIPNMVRSQPSQAKSVVQSHSKIPQSFKKLIPASAVLTFQDNTLNESTIEKQILEGDITLDIRHSVGNKENELW